MPSRTRIRDTGVYAAPGNIVRGDLNAPNPAYRRKIEECTDVVGNYGEENPFNLERKTWECKQPLNGVHYPAIGYPTYFTNFEPIRVITLAPFPSVPGSSSNSVYATQVLARTNPSRAYVDAAVFIGELRDFPGMAKQLFAGALPVYKALRKSGWKNKKALNQAFKQSAHKFLVSARPDSVYLATKFGWEPMFRDIMNYLNATEIFEKRLKEIETLAKTGVSSRKVYLYDKSSESGSMISCNTNIATLKAYETVTIREKVWGSTKWYLDDDSPLKGADSNRVRALTRKALLGMTIDASTAWNLMPWSWLVDWGTTMGDWLDSKRNIVGAHPGKVCIMRHGSSSRTGNREPGMDAYLVPGGSYRSTYERKSRAVLFPPTSPQANLPILSVGQMSILGALATTRLIRNNRL